MERKQGIAAVSKLIGKFTYEIDPKALTADDRASVKETLATAQEALKVAQSRLEARRAELLQDAAYCSLAAAAQEARKYRDQLNSQVYRRKITVGHSNQMFFHVKASGDSWEEVIDILKKKKAKGDVL